MWHFDSGTFGVEPFHDNFTIVSLPLSYCGKVYLELWDISTKSRMQFQASAVYIILVFDPSFCK